jgi:hypothetical protein
LTTPSAAWSSAVLDRMQYVADPPADDAISRIVGPWQVLGADATAEQLRSAHERQWQRLAQATRLLAQMNSNQGLADWAPEGENIDPDIAAALQAYVRSNQSLPPWADVAKLQRAEALFMDDGVLSCVVLFCASMPECFVLPYLSAVLNITGQLVLRTDYRVRSTAAMVVPVMMKGGLSDGSGTGRPQLLKVRLIHATIRNLILRNSPAQAVADLGAGQKVVGAGVVPHLSALSDSQSMSEAMFAHGWKLGEYGVPCNQEELAYTLLTFSYVFLRSMRQLGLGLPAADEEAYLHCWNVAGSVLGVHTDLMAHSMDDAGALFEQIQRRGQADSCTPDPRPALGRALMVEMENVIPVRALKPFAVLMTEYFCGQADTELLGIDQRAPAVSRALFAVTMFTARVIDMLVRLVLPQFSVARLLTRVLGYHLLVKLLMDQTRPLKLPQQLMSSVNTMMVGWSDDPKNPRWMNALEDQLTKPGIWGAS